MRNFIVPIDFSQESLTGLEMAILFSTKEQVNIQLVYVITTLTDYHPSTVSDEHKFAEERFQEIVKKYSPLLGHDSKLRYIIKKGKVYREIISQVNSYKNGFVSASTHGASGFEELFVGSNALKIMSSTSSPVFTIREGSVPKNIKNIVVPIKLHPDTRQKVPMAAEIAKIFGAKIHVVSVSAKNNKRDLERIESYSKQTIGFLKSQKISPTHKTVIGDSLPVLTLNYAEAVDADLIIMMSSAIDKWNVFLGSYAQQMLNRSRFPLLSIKPRTKQLPTGFSTYG